MDGAQLLQLALSGLVTGSIYALVALGFTVIFKSRSEERRVGKECRL